MGERCDVVEKLAVDFCVVILLFCGRVDWMIGGKSVRVRLCIHAGSWELKEASSRSERIACLLCCLLQVNTKYCYTLMYATAAEC